MKATMMGDPEDRGQLAFRLECSCCNAVVVLQVVGMPTHPAEREHVSDPDWDWFCPVCSSAEPSESYPTLQAAADLS